MLLQVDTNTLYAEKLRGAHLREFGIDERKLQDVLFRSLDRLFPDDEMILLMQSRRWREEPDLMAVDEDGNLYIFELKVWESEKENLLQVLRYGQIFGASKFDDLDSWYKKRTNNLQSLSAAHKAKFGKELGEDEFNRKQVFVVMTNGLDHKTREAIRYWRSCGLDIRPWVYRVYKGNSAGEMLLEISAFRVEDNPYEDLAEGYFILNTNFRNDPSDHADMLKHQKAAAYFDPWKFKIERLGKGDLVFLYQSGVGIVATGESDGNLQKTAYKDDPQHSEQEFFVQLRNFQLVDPPISASEIKALTGLYYVFMSTMFGVDAEGGMKIKQAIVADRS